ncbi:hypothetical protein [Oryzihumus leptocrescens]|uniref:hypothetical protein n=1 Tax=Oryzihumus leptocrescens TaxID=297536 RepID=UPI001150A35A|nr:hypothetical protein [Oryzihumus leptocrescens]
MGDGISEADIVVALIRGVLKKHGASTAAEISAQIERPGVTPSRVTAILSSNAPLFEREGDRWSVARLTPAAVLQLQTGSPTKARRYQRGPLHFAVLPDWVEKLVCQRLTDEEALTAEELHAHLRQRGWKDISQADLLLHLAHFDDYSLNHGKWSLKTASGAAATQRRLPLSSPSDKHQQPVAPTRPSINNPQSFYNRPVTLISGGVAERMVYITGKGQAYHWDPDCHLLRMGWAKSLGDGGGVTGLRPVTVGQAINASYHACRGCTGSG